MFGKRRSFQPFCDGSKQQRTLWAQKVKSRNGSTTFCWKENPNPNVQRFGNTQMTIVEKVIVSPKRANRKTERSMIGLKMFMTKSRNMHRASSPECGLYSTRTNPRSRRRGRRGPWRLVPPPPLDRPLPGLSRPLPGLPRPVREGSVRPRPLLKGPPRRLCSG